MGQSKGSNIDRVKQWLDCTLHIGDTIRARIAAMDGYNYSDYSTVRDGASAFIDDLSQEAADINYAAILRARANDPKTQNASYLTFATKEHPEGAERYTYREASLHANKAAEMFAEHGLGAGAKIVLRSTAPEHLFARNGGLINGSVIAPLSVRYSDDEMFKRLELIEADAVVTTVDLMEQIIRVRDRSERDFTIFVVERDEKGAKLTGQEKKELLDNIRGLENIVPYMEATAKYKGEDVEIGPVEPSQVAFNMTTSGSSGSFRVVEIPHTYGLASFIRSNPWWGVNGAATSDDLNTNPQKVPDKVFVTAPPGWMYFYRGVGVSEVSGAEVIMHHTPGYKRDIAFMSEVMEKTGATVFAGIPPLYNQLNGYFEREGAPELSLRRAISTGEVLNADTIWVFMEQTKLVIANCYAATEEGPMIAYPEGMNLPIGCVGVVLPGVEYKMHKSSEAGKPEFFVRQTAISASYKGKWRGLGLMEGSDGVKWRNLRDTLKLDRDVVVSLTRADDLIKRLGIQIFPHEIEEKMASVFHNAQVNCTFGIEDREKNTTILVSYVEIPEDVLKERGQKEIKELLEQKVSELSTFKRPNLIIVAPTRFVRGDNKTFPKRIRSGVQIHVMPHVRRKKGLVILPPLDQSLEHNPQIESEGHDVPDMSGLEVVALNISRSATAKISNPPERGK